MATMAIIGMAIIAANGIESPGPGAVMLTAWVFVDLRPELSVAVTVIV